MTDVRCRPIDRWDGPRLPSFAQRRGPFGASWATIQDDLERELEHLDARDVVIGIDLAEYQIRIDGWPKGGATVPAAVVLTFDSSQGPLRFQCDRWDHWHHNLRAIGLTLQRLRLVDEGGVARSGEQYRGWGALPPGGPTEVGPAMTVEAAARFVVEHARPAAPDEHVRRTAQQIADRAGGRDDYRTELFREAARRLHPDAGGDPAMFRRLVEARELLEAQP